MDKQQLLTLARSSKLSPRGLAARDLDAFAALAARAENEVKNRLVDSLEDASAEVREALSEVPLNLGAATSVREALLASLATAAADPVRREAAVLVADSAAVAALENPLYSDRPLAEQPLFQPEIARGTLYLIAEAAELSESKAESLVLADTTLAGVSDSVLQPLVDEGTLEEHEAVRVGLTASLFFLAGEDMPLATAIRDAATSRLGNGLSEVRELVALDASDWRRVVQDAQPTMPEGETVESLAATLADRIARLYPTDALLARVLPMDEQTMRDASDAVRSGEPARVEAAARAFPALGILETAGDPKLSATRRASILTRRIRTVQRLRELNHDAELLALDLSADSDDVRRLRTDGVAEEDLRQGLSTLRAYQRTLSITGDVAGAEQLMKAGYTSALAITGERFDDFQQRCALPEADAQKYYTEAQSAVTSITGLLGSVLDVTAGSFELLEVVANLQPSAQNYVRRLDGYSTLFGGQTFCACEHCGSVLSPAAYFVDLMRFIDDRITSPYFGSTPEHPLNLEVRRPDLWTTPLTCQATEELVPTIDLINEIGENYLATSGGFTGSLSDRPAVQAAVYRDRLAQSVSSLHQPFMLPLTRLTAYLDHLERPRDWIARVLGASATAVAAAVLGLSRKQYELITQAQKTRKFLRDVYDLPLTGSGGTIEPFDAQELVAALSVTREQLGDLVGSRFVAGSGAAIRLVSEKTDASSVQNDIELVRDVTATALDRLHRLTRLWRHTPWSIREVDLVLSALGATVLTTAQLDTLARVLVIQRKLGVSADVACAVAIELPTHSTGARPSLFDRLFNSPPFVAQDGAYPKDAARFVHHALRDTAGSVSDPTQHRLLAALGVDDETLLRLIRGLAKPLGADLSAENENDRGFALTVANLSLLYRHVQLARLLRMPVADLLRLIEHIPAIADGHVRGLGDVETLLDHTDWWRASGYSLDDLAVICRRPPVDPRRYPTPEVVVDAVLAEVTAEQSLRFADTVFAFAEGVTEEQSRRLVAANPSRILPAPGGQWRLAADFDLTAALTVPDGLPVDEPAARAALARHHPSELLPARLAGKLGVTPDAARALFALADVDLSSGALPAALHGDQPKDALVVLVRDLLPLRVLFQDTAYDAVAIDFVQANPGMFAIDDVRDLSIDTCRQVSRYAHFAHLAAEQEPPQDTERLRDLLVAFQPDQGFAAAHQQRLAALLAVEPASLASLAAAVTLPAEALAALERLAATVGLARHLGVGGPAIAGILADDYDTMQQAADALLAALRARYPESEWPNRIGPLEDTIRSRKRDAVCDHLLRSEFPHFQTRGDLYEHFLIDVDLQGCARTSRVVAATSSAQLYVHRVLMNLEQDRRDPADPARVHIKPTSIDPDEWKWRRNYRVWEANRKVFLWPENYIEPELRDDKTPLFEELEATLLQQPIDEQTVLDAYAAYLTGFEELANLRIAGSYHEKDHATKKDVLHVFGVTSADPPVYYYRTAENAHYGAVEPGHATVWSPWRKIDVQISARRVSPIVVDGRLHVFWVNYATRPKTDVSQGASRFVGYTHTVKVYYTTVRLDGTWTAPQQLRLREHQPYAAEGVLDDPRDASGQPLYDTVPHAEPKEQYTLRGVRWERVFPWLDNDGRLVLTTAGFQASSPVDLFDRKEVDRPYAPYYVLQDGLMLHLDADRQLRTRGPYYPTYDRATMLLDRMRVTAGYGRQPFSWGGPEGGPVDKYLAPDPILRLTPSTELSVINGSTQDLILDDGGDALMLQGSVRQPPRYLLRRMGTTLAARMARLLFTSGVDGLLSLKTQQSLGEDPHTVTGLNTVDDEVVTGSVDFTGPFGTYFREVFFHIPFLLANHLNSQQKFAAAQRWYHYLFDPTANEVIPPSPDPRDREQQAKDRNWRYIEFRGLNAEKLRASLTDPGALQAYRSDPFNPHAIARLRLSAYQKTLVMKYVDNLIDWADSLFAQFTPESINEATMLYAMAAAVLGERPPELGKCGEEDESLRTYEAVAPLLGQDGEFLLEFETWYRGKVRLRTARGADGLSAARYAVPPIAIRNAAGRERSARLAPPATATEAAAQSSTAIGRFFGWKTAKTVSWRGVADTAVAVRDQEGSYPVHQIGTVATFGLSLTRQVGPVFCIPMNQDLLALWDRVGDRLYKIRNCLDIEGVRRQPPMFAPEIDPRLLVRARVAGLSLDEVLNASAGDLPPYRFTHLIERAKVYASTVQGFGSALLAALEKKDVEELNRLRITQQQNQLTLATRVRQWDIDTAADAAEALRRQRAAAEYRRDYFLRLVDSGLSSWENWQAIARHTVSATHAVEGTLQLLSGSLHLIPQLGSPLAMKYGGFDLGSSLGRFGHASQAAASIAEAVAASTGLEAGFERREEGWEHQRELAQHDMDVLDKQIEAADIRHDVALWALRVHERTIEQLDEIEQFMVGKFSNLGLYTWLSGSLQRVYREAYNSAYAMARLAEQAYRFERDETGELLGSAHWEWQHAGLLAGERLLVDLQAMERRFLETNYRDFEIDQAFSLTQIDPAALVRLREEGACEFTVPELYFDLLYPGHYRRRIRAVRLTIPAVTGPYTNVSATLSLVGSELRRAPQLDAAALVDVPLRRSTSIATSTAQQDAGVFELSFRDERYMPFEGAGVASKWKLSLPRAFRPFDYRTITDVILHITYTAKSDEPLRHEVETSNASVEGSLTALLTSGSLTRVFSLRSDLSGVLQRLLQDPVGTDVRFRLDHNQLPLFLQGRPLQATSAKIALMPKAGQSVKGLRLLIDTHEVTSFPSDATLGGLPTANVASVLAPKFLGEHTIRVVDPGDLSPTEALPGDLSALDAEKLRDILLIVDYQLSTTQ